jgi:hypothetical protein
LKDWEKNMGVEKKGGFWNGCISRTCRLYGKMVICYEISMAEKVNG